MEFFGNELLRIFRTLSASIGIIYVLSLYITFPEKRTTV